MKINFVLPGIQNSGGVKVVFEYANRLQEMGHDVFITYPGLIDAPVDSKGWKIEAPLRKFKYALDDIRGINEHNWFALKVPVYRIPSLEEKYLHSADVIIATHNRTADWVSKLSPRCGEKFYFIQGFEVWDREPSLVINTWKLPLKKIVISSYLKNIAQDMGEEVVGLIINGLDSKAFYNENPTFNTPPKKILMLSHEDEAKGITDGLKAFEIAKNKFPYLELTMFGVRQARADMPPGTSYYQNPSQAKIRDLYCEADIYLFPSRQEGFGLTPMEAMACAAAVVTTNVGGIPDYTISGETALVTEPNNPKQLAEGIIKLTENPSWLKEIAIAGQKQVSQISWDKAVVEFEEVLLRDGNN